MIDEAIEEECGDFTLDDVIPTIQFEVIAPPTISSLITGMLNLRLNSNMDPLLVFFLRIRHVLFITFIHLNMHMTC